MTGSGAACSSILEPVADKDQASCQPSPTSLNLSMTASVLPYKSHIVTRYQASDVLQLCVACRDSALAAASLKRASSLMVVTKRVTPAATHFCQVHLIRVPHVSAFPLRRLSGRQSTPDRGSGRLCLHTLEVTSILGLRLCDFAGIEVLQCQLLSLSVRYVLPVRS